MDVIAHHLASAAGQRAAAAAGHLPTVQEALAHAFNAIASAHFLKTQLRLGSPFCDRSARSGLSTVRLHTAALPALFSVIG